jgi:hypothetical protein
MLKYKLQSILILVATAGTMVFTGCDTESNPIDQLEVPGTYAFMRDGNSTVDFEGQTQRLDQLDLIVDYMKTANVIGAPALDAMLLKNMFSNTGNPFVGHLFTKDLKSKCFANDVPQLEAWMDEVAAASALQQEASEGIAGVLVQGSLDPTVGYLVNINGIQLGEVIEKSVMGGVFFYQAMETYLSVDRMGQLDNDSLVDLANYTNMEHYLDEAFGYTGIPVDYPSLTSIDEARFWGEYISARNEGLYPGIASEFATAFRTARAAIVAKDYQARDEAIHTIQEKWAIVIASSAVDYLSASLSTEGLPVYRKNHKLSEAIGFCIALKYHFSGGNSIFPPVYSYQSIEEAMDIIGPTTNLYAVDDDAINAAILKVKEAFPVGVIK